MNHTESGGRGVLLHAHENSQVETKVTYKTSAMDDLMWAFERIVFFLAFLLLGMLAVAQYHGYSPLAMWNILVWWFNATF